MQQFTVVFIAHCSTTNDNIHLEADDTVSKRKNPRGGTQKRTFSKKVKIWDLFKNYDNYNSCKY